MKRLITIITVTGALILSAAGMSAAHEIHYEFDNEFDRKLIIHDHEGPHPGLTEEAEFERDGDEVEFEAEFYDGREIDYEREGDEMEFELDD